MTDEEFEKRIVELVAQVEAARAAHKSAVWAEREMVELKKQHGPRKITGEARITIPIPRSSK